MTWKNHRGYELVDELFPVDEEWAQPLREASLLRIDEDTTPAALLRRILPSVTQPEMPEDGEFVSVMSLHKSKGLTNKVVIVTDCVEGLVPTIDTTQPLKIQRAAREEQRRLFYVAITRPTEILALSSVRQIDPALAYQMGARVRRNGETVTSGFIAELGPSAPTPRTGKSWIRAGFQP